MLDIAIAVGGGAFLILVLVFALRWVGSLLQKAQANQQPGVEEVLDALTPWIFRAILAGERSILWGFEEVDRKLEGMDKKAVADSVYALLPETIVIGNISLPVSVIKAFVPRDVFEARVKDLYDAADAFIESNKAYLKSQVDALKPLEITFTESPSSG